MDDEKGAGTDVRGTEQSGPDESIMAVAEQLVDSGKELAEAELAWIRLKGLSIAAIAKRGALFGITTAACLTVGLTLLLVAAVVALTPVTGLLAAILIVAVIAFVGAWLCGRLAHRAWLDIFGEDKA